MSPMNNFCSVKFEYHFYDINEQHSFCVLNICLCVYLVAQGLMGSLAAACELFVAPCGI